MRRPSNDNAQSSAASACVHESFISRDGPLADRLVKHSDERHSFAMADAQAAMARKATKGVLLTEKLRSLQNSLETHSARWVRSKQ